MNILVKDVLGILDNFIHIKIVMKDVEVADGIVFDDNTVLYDGIKPEANEGILDETTLNLEVMFLKNEYDKETEEIITTIYTYFPYPKKEEVHA